jgi:hypothetical protein
MAPRSEGLHRYIVNRDLGRSQTYLSGNLVPPSRAGSPRRSCASTAGRGPFGLARLAVALRGVVAGSVSRFHSSLFVALFSLLADPPASRDLPTPADDDLPRLSSCTPRFLVMVVLVSASPSLRHRGATSGGYYERARSPAVLARAPAPACACLLAGTYWRAGRVLVSIFATFTAGNPRVGARDVGYSVVSGGSRPIRLATALALSRPSFLAREGRSWRKSLLNRRRRGTRGAAREKAVSSVRPGGISLGTPLYAVGDGSGGAALAPSLRRPRFFDGGAVATPGTRSGGFLLLIRVGRCRKTQHFRSSRSRDVRVFVLLGEIPRRPAGRPASRRPRDSGRRAANVSNVALRRARAREAMRREMPLSRFVSVLRLSRGGFLKERATADKEVDIGRAPSRSTFPRDD